jgi:hypothetical protein
MTTIVFMHTGPEVELATIMVRSFRRQNPLARIVQVADEHSPVIGGADEIVRHRMTDRNIMLFRMRCFAAFPTTGPTWFLDTDMICNRPLDFAVGAQTSVAVCRRDFDRDAVFNHRFRGMDFSEYEGRTLGSLYPYVGCATMLNDSNFWMDCLANMEALPAKFHHWYGDQEAIRNIVASGRYEVADLPEQLYACLPEYETPAVLPMISHYKGRRKPLMLERAARDGLL